MKFQLKLSSVTMGGNRSNKQLDEIKNITNFYKSREKITKFYNHYFKMVHKAACDSKHGKCLKSNSYTSA